MMIQREVTIERGWIPGTSIATSSRSCNPIQEEFSLNTWVKRTLCQLFENNFEVESECKKSERGSSVRKDLSRTRRRTNGF